MVEDGDIISIDIPAGRLDVELSDEIERQNMEDART